LLRQSGVAKSLPFTKAANSPNSVLTSTSGLLGTEVTDFVGMMPTCAAGQAFARCMQVSLGRSQYYFIPNVTAAATGASFVKEGDSIPVRQQSISGIVMQPKKLAVICPFTREAFQHSTPSAEAVVGAVVEESIAAKLDSLAFDAVAGDDTRPAGLRNNINALAASNATPLSEAMSLDLGGLTAAVSPVAGANEIIFIAAPGQANAIKLRYPNFGFPVFASSGLAAGVVIAIASNCLVSAIDPNPVIQASTQAVLVYDDTSPANIGVGGSLASSPVQSLYQADGVALRIVLGVTWALRSTSGLAWTQSVTW
jgi:capsid protein